MHIHPSDLSAELWQDEGEPDHKWRLQHSSGAFLFFLYNSPYIVYNPNHIWGEENNLYFDLDS